MFQIQNLTDYPKQKQTLVLPDGSQIGFAIMFVPQQLGWFIRELTYGDFILNGVRICNSPNLLHQFRNQIPFGLQIDSAEDREPSLSSDFLSGYTTINVLTAAEVEQFNKVLTDEI